TRFELVFKLILMRQDLDDGVSVAGRKRHDGGVDDALIFTGELFFDQRRQLLGIKMKNLRDQAEDENVFALVFGRAAECFDCQSGNGYADINKTFVVEVGLDVVRIVKQDAAFFEKVDVVLITVLIKRDEKIVFVTGRQNFARAHPDLEDRRAARDGGRDRHVSHDIVVAAAREPREKSAGGLNAVLRIPGETEYRVITCLR